MPVCPLVGAGLVTRQVSIPAEQVVFLKAILEASEGLGAVFAEQKGSGRYRGGGDLVIAAPDSRADELDELLADLALELGAPAADGRVEVGAPFFEPLPTRE